MNYDISIKALRMKCGLSQEELAHELGVSFATINRWERGKTTPSRMALKAIQRFCEKRNITIDEHRWE